MLDPRMKFDRYHGAMGNFSLSDCALVDDQSLADKIAVFYTTQRKIPYAPCVGHERLLESLLNKRLDIPRLRFLKNDKADLSLVADNLNSAVQPFIIRAVTPGRIMFAGEPFADIEGPFGITQM